MKNKIEGVGITEDEFSLLEKEAYFNNNIQIDELPGLTEYEAKNEFNLHLNNLGYSDEEIESLMKNEKSKIKLENLEDEFNNLTEEQRKELLNLDDGFDITQKYEKDEIDELNDALIEEEQETEIQGL